LTRLPDPIPGLVIRYSYLWQAEFLSGREDGEKVRPCAIVAAVRKTPAGLTVLVLPITHSPPRSKALAMELAPDTKSRLGLDGERSWVVFSEANRFRWPGPDLRPSRNGDMATVAFGELPASFFLRLREAFLNAYRARQAAVVNRTD
jgi:hypothetical protein